MSLNTIRKKVVAYFAKSPFSTLCIMALSFLGFGYFSFNLFFLFQSNIVLIKSFGLLALQEGAAIQFLMIVLNTFMSVIFYTIWKICERLLVDWFLRK
ncbi:MAG: hypothetical protein ACRBBR_04025 [Cellvibrionaceae bacterium]